MASVDSVAVLNSLSSLNALAGKISPQTSTTGVNVNTDANCDNTSTESITNGTTNGEG